MAIDGTPKPEEPTVRWWMLLPFVEQIFAVALLALLAPAAWGVSLLARGSILLGGVVLVCWLFAFGWVAYSLQRTKGIRMVITVPCAALFLVVCGVSFFSP